MGVQSCSRKRYRASIKTSYDKFDSVFEQQLFYGRSQPRLFFIATNTRGAGITADEGMTSEKYVMNMTEKSVGPKHDAVE